MPEAEVKYRKFEEFLPFSPANINLAQYFYLTRQYDQAVDLLTRKLETTLTFRLRTSGWVWFMNNPASHRGVSKSQPAFPRRTWPGCTLLNIVFDYAP